MGLVRLLLMLFLWKGVLCDDEAIHKYYRLTVPQTVTAQEGLCVLIPCQFTIQETGEAAERPHGYWIIKGEAWDGPAVASNDGTREIRADTRGRFKLVGDVTRRDCSLRIDDVSTGDTRTYYFRYEHSRRSSIKYNYNFYPLIVTVVALQDTPEISLRDPVMEGERVTVRCTAPGRCSGTAPEITWSPESEVKYREDVYNTDGTRTYTSTITFIAAMEHNNKRLSCTTYFPAVRKYTKSSVSLTVGCRQDTPEISLPGRVIEGETVNVRCMVRGRCSGTVKKINWTSESKVKYLEQVYGAYNPDGTVTYTSAITFTAAMEHNNKRLSCTAYFPAVNKYITSSGSLTVDYPPRTPKINYEDVTTQDWSEKQENISFKNVLEGRSVNILCSVDSSPLSNLTWIKGEKPILEKESIQNLTLSLSNVEFENQGQYWCVAKNKHGLANSSLVINIESQKLPPLLLIGGTVTGAVVLAGVCLLAWLISRKVRRFLELKIIHVLVPAQWTPKKICLRTSARTTFSMQQYTFPEPSLEVNPARFQKTPCIQRSKCTK
ncbi:sialic acid-binding Ig-like lectin 13 isoform X2 [Lissotriton helveticus]